MRFVSLDGSEDREHNGIRSVETSGTFATQDVFFMGRHYIVKYSGGFCGLKSLLKMETICNI